MDERQTKLIVAAAGAIVLAIVIWWFFGVKGPKNGVADLPKPPARGSMPAQPPAFAGQNQPNAN